MVFGAGWGVAGGEGFHEFFFEGIDGDLAGFWGIRMAVDVGRGGVDFTEGFGDVGDVGLVEFGVLFRVIFCGILRAVDRGHGQSSKNVRATKMWRSLHDIEAETVPELFMR